MSTTLNTLKQPKTYIKAIWAGATTAVGALAILMVGSVEIGDITQGQWAAVVSTVLVNAGGVYGLTNKPVTDA
jgi:hypothetical protein